MIYERGTYSGMVGFCVLPCRCFNILLADQMLALKIMEGGPVDDMVEPSYATELRYMLKVVLSMKNKRLVITALCFVTM